MPFHQVGSIYFFIFYFYILYIYSIAYSEDGCIYRKVFFPQKKKRKKKSWNVTPNTAETAFFDDFTPKTVFFFYFFLARTRYDAQLTQGRARTRGDG